MSIHPNTLLMAHLSPEDLPRKTYLSILEDAGTDPDDPIVKIGDDEYYLILLGSGGYDDGFQVSGMAGEIVLMDMVTYGYGERMGWDDLAAQKATLSAWIEENRERYNIGTSSISIGANYW